MHKMQVTIDSENLSNCLQTVDMTIARFNNHKTYFVG